jgi:hypothetical protein
MGDSAGQGQLSEDCHMRVSLDSITPLLVAGTAAATTYPSVTLSATATANITAAQLSRRRGSGTGHP